MLGASSLTRYLNVQIDELIKTFLAGVCNETTLTPDCVEAHLPIALTDRIKTKAFGKELVSLSFTYRERRQFDRLRASLFVGTVLLGKKFLTGVERRGLLLPDRSLGPEFKQFLSQFEAELRDATDANLALLKQRLSTYLALYDFYDVLMPAQSAGATILENRPRIAIKSALALTHLYFLQQKLSFRLGIDLDEFFNEFQSPEDMASVVSMLVAAANENSVLDAFDFGPPFGAEIISDEIRSLMRYGIDSYVQHETTKLISLFGYGLVKSTKTLFQLRPPTREFEYAVRLGLIRGELGASNISVLISQEPVPVTSIFAAANLLVDAWAGHLSQLVDVGTPFERIRLKFPVAPKVYNEIIDATFLEDLEYRYQLSLDALLPMDHADEVQITKHLNLQTFHRMWQLLRLIGLVHVIVLTQHAESNPRAVLNSLVSVSTEEALVSLIKNMGFTEAQVVDFFDLVSADVRDLGYFDLQYRPILKIAQNILRLEGKLVETPPEIISVSGLILLSNILRNLQTSNQIRFKANAEAFVEIVARMIKTKFPKVTTNQRLQLGQKVTDVDIAILQDAVLYLIECKHSVPGAAVHEMRDMWEDIERGSEQLKLAEEILTDSSKRQSYLAGWFPGTRQADTLNLRIQPCILCSHREFSGLDYEGIPIRDFSSLSLLFGDGLVGMGTMSRNGKVTMYRHRIVGENGPTQLDLDDYLSVKSKYFAIWRPFMQTVTTHRTLAEGNITLETETFKFEMDLDQWLRHLDILGFARQPIEKHDVNLRAIFERGSDSDGESH